ncbi:tandem-95 repeat protein [Rhodobacteraceae bacterium NNCM2]|nr:tandem-95 repeat protein [Coraliihabitans acroporae]
MNNAMETTGVAGLDVDNLVLSGAFTFETWVYFEPGTVIDNKDGLFSSDGAGGVNQDLNFYKGRLRLFSQGPGKDDKIVSNTAASTGEWTHYAVTRDESGNLSLYVNGVLDATGSFNGDVTISSLGSTFGGVSEAKFDNMRIWSVERGAAEIAAMMNSSVDPSSTGLERYYDFDGDGSVVTDLTGNTADVAVPASINMVASDAPGSDAPTNQPPVAANDSAQTDEDTPVVVDVLANDSDADGTIDPTTVAIASGPSNGSVGVDPVTGEITYTPDSGFVGSDSFTYTVSDGEDASAPATVSLTVGDFVPLAMETTGTTGLDIDNVTLSGAFTFETWVYFEPGTIINQQDGLFSSDGAGGVNQDLNFYKGRLRLFSQGPGNDDKVVANSVAQAGVWTHYAVTRDAAGNLTIYVNGVQDATGSFTGDVTVSTLGAAFGGVSEAKFDNTRIWSVERSAGEISATMNTSVDPAATGLERAYSYDGDGSVVTDLTGNSADVAVPSGINLVTSDAPVNGAASNLVPNAEDDAATTEPNTPVVVDVLANDSDPDGSIDPTSVVIVTGPSSGTVDVDPVTGEVTYTPNGGFTGRDSFTYTVSDGEDVSDPATVNVTVMEPLNQPPVAANDQAQTDEDTPVVVDVLANDSDADGTIDPTSVVIASGPSNGTVDVDPVTGAITYTPNGRFTGSDSFTYTVSDGTDASDPATVNITVGDALPLAMETTGTTGLDVDDLTLSGAFTFETWVYFEPGTVINQQDGLFSSNGAGGVNQDLNFYNGQLRLFSQGPGKDDKIVANTAAQTGVWTHYAVTRDASGNLSLYVDGVLDASASGFTADVTIGSLGAAFGGVSEAKFDNLRIWSVERSGGEIAATMNASVDPASTGLERAYSFDGDGSVVTDLTGNSSTVSVPAGINLVASDAPVNGSPANVPPVVTNDQAQTDEDTPVVVDVLANDSDPDGTIDPTSVVIASGPSNGTVDVDPVTGEITYTPNGGFTGTDSFTYTVSDGTDASDPATVSVTVGDSLSLAMETTGSTGLDIEDVVLSDAFTFETWVYFEPGTTIDNTDGLFSSAGAGGANQDLNFYQGRLRLFSQGPGNDDKIVANTVAQTGAWMHYAVTRDASGNLKLYVNGVLDASAGGFTDDVTIGALGAAFGGVSEAKFDNTRIWSVERSAGDIAATLNTSVDPATPGLERAYSYDGDGTVVTDLTGNSADVPVPAGINMVVSDAPVNGEPENIAPIAANDSVQTDPDTPIVVDVLANDSDPDGTIDPTTVVIDSDPTNGSVSVDPVTGEVTYTPNGGFTGSDSFTYTVSDGTDTSDPATVNVTVGEIGNTSLRLTGGNNAVDVDDLFIPGAFTVEFWINLPSSDPVSGADVIMRSGERAVSTYLTFNNDGLLTLRESRVDQIASSTAAVTDTWTHYAITRDNQGILRLYIDGALDATAATEWNILFSMRDLFGAVSADIDNLRIWSVERSQAEIAANKDVDLDPAYQGGLERSYSFDAEDGSQIVDGTGNSATVDLPNGGSIVESTLPTVEDTPELNTPRATDDFFSLPEDAINVPLSVLNNDFDPNGDNITIVSATDSANGTVSIVNGELIYNPDADFVGTDSFEYTISDGVNQDTATVEINVVPSHEQPQSVLNDIIPDEISPSGLTMTLQKYAQIPVGADGQNARMNMVSTLGDRVFVSTEGRLNNESEIYELVDNGDGTATAVLFFDVGAAVFANTGRNLDNTNIVHGGLRGLDFHPDFFDPNSDGYGKFYTSIMEERPADTTGHFYLSDSDTPVEADGVLIEWTYDHGTGTVDENSYREVFRVGMHVYDHSMKDIKFNPFAEPGDEDYGLLYVAHGDGSEQSAIAGDGQNNDALGKILRLDPLENGDDPFSIPSTNPFVLNPNEFVTDTTDINQPFNLVYAYGMRNPHTFSFAEDAEGNVHLLSGESGRDNFEEVNIIVAGGNYGWGDREGPFVHDQPTNGIVTGLDPLPADEAQNGYIFPVSGFGHDGPTGVSFVGQAIASGHVIQNGTSELDDQFIFVEFATSGKAYHIDFSEALEQVTSLDPNDPTRDEPDELTMLDPYELTILFDHDNDDSTAAVVHDSIKDVFDDEGSFATVYSAGESRADIRLGEGANGELLVINKRNGWVYIVEETIPDDLIV